MRARKIKGSSETSFYRIMGLESKCCPGNKFYQKILYGLKMSNYKEVEGSEVCERELYLRILSQ
jgi:hypothetical protein